MMIGIAGLVVVHPGNRVFAGYPAKVPLGLGASRSLVSPEDLPRMRRFWWCLHLTIIVGAVGMLMWVISWMRS